MCWSPNPAARPTAAQLVQHIKAAMLDRGVLSAPGRPPSKLGPNGVQVPGSPGGGHGGSAAAGLATSPHQRSAQLLTRAASVHMCGLDEFAPPVQQYPSAHPAVHRPYGRMDWAQLVGAAGASSAGPAGNDAQHADESEMDTFPMHIL
jgi:hypothetical protein